MLNQVSAGHFRARAFEAAITFVFGGAIFLASHNITSESASARLLQDRPFSGATMMPPDQHRAPIVRPVPAPRPLPMQRLPMQRRADPIQIDPSQRQAIVQRQANEMKREHCLRKLEARRRALKEEQRSRNNPAK
ncbi:MAG TPA: hypothetical protein VFH95_01950 [Candidatus Kapabacteria bacterium]|nr:hypothetical protein [Candidatus Kapabacteria bacterium]